MAAAYVDAPSAAARGALDATLTSWYGDSDLDRQRRRCANLLSRMEARAGLAGALLVSEPGRTELGGNHTDHNHGKVLAAAVQFDCLAVAVPTRGHWVRIRSEGFPDSIEVNLTDLTPVPGEEGTSAALVRGIAAAFVDRGFRIGAFDGCMTGNIPVGSGLSSSAAFEIAIGSLFNHLFNRGSASPLDLAAIGRHAENVHFGKPCGFMDQITCAEKGILFIDFYDPDHPAIHHLDLDFERTGYRLTVVDTGGSHADLTPEYAAIPEEMFRGARVLGHNTARDLSLDQVFAAIPELRTEAGDRAVLRLIHFIEENRRVQQQAEALQQDDMATYLELVRASGDSSWRLLQNCAASGNPRKQNIPLALTLTERFLQGEGACRVHGGGFAGTIQAYVPKARLDHYRRFMEKIFGPGSVIALRIRQPGIDWICLDGYTR